VSTTKAQQDKAQSVKIAVNSAQAIAIANAERTFKASSAVTRGAVLKNAVDQADRDLADARAAIDRFYGAGVPVPPGVNPDSAAGVAAVAGLT
jgi:hypothetical protein